jgi:hypothetical protein
MQTTPRGFTRQFPVFRKAALAGKAVAIRDREGHEFTFALKRSSPKTLAAQNRTFPRMSETGKTVLFRFFRFRGNRSCVASPQRS